jgi:hypothetical protein
LCLHETAKSGFADNSLSVPGFEDLDSVCMQQEIEWGDGHLDDMAVHNIQLVIDCHQTDTKLTNTKCDQFTEPIVTV